MVRKLMMAGAAALVGAALLAMPSAPGFAQAGTKGVGSPRTSTGPGTDMGNPSVTNDTGPGANPIAGNGPKRHAKRTRHHRSTVGSSSMR